MHTRGSACQIISYHETASRDSGRFNARSSGPIDCPKLPKQVRISYWTNGLDCYQAGKASSRLYRREEVTERLTHLRIHARIWGNSNTDQARGDSTCYKAPTDRTKRTPERCTPFNFRKVGMLRIRTNQPW